MCNGWPVKKTIVKLQTRMKGNLKHTSGNSVSLSGPQNKDIGTASQTLLTKLINYVFKAGYISRCHLYVLFVESFFLFVSVLLITN